MTKADTTKAEPIIIKKYANRRLYNTATSSYVTLDHLAQMVKDGLDFIVYDAKTGEDITRSVLTQIIVEEESKGGQNLLPISFLRQLISFYGDNMKQMMLPQYLEFAMQSFSENQEKMQKYMQDTFGTVFPFGGLEEMGKQNMAMFEKAMQFFNPFAAENQKNGTAPKETTTDSRQDTAPGGMDINELRQQLEIMQKQLDNIEGGKK